MGREVRKVPPNWEHPKDGTGSYRPLLEPSYEEAAQEWTQGFNAWQAGTHPDLKYVEEPAHYWEWAGSPPEKEDHIPYTEDEATWFQLYETVSEGTPVSPPFPTLEEIARYLVDYGDFWYQRDMREGRSTFRHKPSYEQALGMVRIDWWADENVEEEDEDEPVDPTGDDVTRDW